jgi:hypothetical protein
LIAICIGEPASTAEEIDGWSERARSIARVAAAQVIGCGSAYRRSAGSGRSGDERLVEAMNLRDAEIGQRLRETSTALRTGLGANVVSLFDSSRLFQDTAVNRIFEDQRRLGQFVHPPYMDAVMRLSKPFQEMAPNYTDQMSALSGSAVLRSLKLLNPIRDQLSNEALFGLHDGRSRLFGVGGLLHRLEIGKSPLFTQFEQLRKVTRGFNPPRPLFASALGLDAARLTRSFATPRYFGALHDLARPSFPDVSRLTRASFHARLPEIGPSAIWLDRLREQIAAPFRAYVVWAEKEWASRKATKRAAPILFLLASLPALVGLQLLEELATDDELLLARCEAELTSGTLASELQAAVQQAPVLDAIAKRHIVQALEWIAAGREVDAVPPLYDGLERTFRLTARAEGVIDADNRFLIPGSHRSRMHTIEDTFRYLGLDPLYLRYLQTWIFGETGNLVRHGDLPEEEHRAWVIRATIALVGWLELAGGCQDAVSDLVARLELERWDEALAG